MYVILCIVLYLSRQPEKEAHGFRFNEKLGLFGEELAGRLHTSPQLRLSHALAFSMSPTQ